MHTALENGNLDAAAWLCVRGYACGCGPYRTKSLLYLALRERQFDVARILLDPTAAEGERIDGRVAAAIDEAARDAVSAGDLTVATWLRTRYKHVVDEVVARLRADPWPMRSPVPTIDTVRTLFRALRERA